MVLQDIEVEELKTKVFGGTQGELSSGLGTQEEKEDYQSCFSHAGKQVTLTLPL